MSETLESKVAAAIDAALEQQASAGTYDAYYEGFKLTDGRPLPLFEGKVDVSALARAAIVVAVAHERAQVAAHLRAQADISRALFETEAPPRHLSAPQLIERYRAKYIAEAYTATAEAIEAGWHVAEGDSQP